MNVKRPVLPPEQKVVSSNLTGRTNPPFLNNFETSFRKKLVAYTLRLGGFNAIPHNTATDRSRSKTITSVGRDDHGSASGPAGTIHPRADVCQIGHTQDRGMVSAGVPCVRRSDEGQGGHQHAHHGATQARGIRHEREYMAAGGEHVLSVG